jgi:integrase
MKAVAKLDLPYVQAFKDRHGTLRHYYRRKGFKTTALPGQVGSAEFMDAYREAEARTRPASPQKAIQPRSISALITKYYQSVDYRDLRESTKRGYRNMLDRFRDKHGDKGAASIEPKHLESIFLAMADTPGATANLRKRLRKVFRLAVRLGWRASNPVDATEFKRKRSGGFKSWTEDDISAYQERWPSGTRERLALALLLYTGQRRSDVVGMGRQHVSEGRISVRQLKTDARLKIRLHPALLEEIEAHSGMTYLVTHQGAAFTAAGFGNWFREKALEAGVQKTAHGLRKAAGRRMAEAGCTAKEIAAVLGHTTLSEVERYTRDADQVLLSDSAADKLAANETRRAGVKPSVSNPPEPKRHKAPR